MFNILLVVHILGAIIFVGNIITAAFWKVRADRSGNLETIALSTRAVLLADFAFTTPGILAVLGSGIAMAGLTGWERFQEPWLATSFILFVITGFIWAAALLPLQMRMARLARQSVAQGVLDPAYQRTSKRWAMLGGIATALPIIILFFMVLKPQF